MFLIALIGRIAKKAFPYNMFSQSVPSKILQIKLTSISAIKILFIETGFLYKMLPYIIPAIIALNVNPGKKGPVGLSIYFTISVIAPNILPTIGPNKKPIPTVVNEENPIFKKLPIGTVKAPSIIESATNIATVVIVFTFFNSLYENKNISLIFIIFITYFLLQPLSMAASSTALATAFAIFLSSAEGIIFSGFKSSGFIYSAIALAAAFFIV